MDKEQIDGIHDASTLRRLNEENLDIWDRVAEYWDQSLGSGNDLYQECILPTIKELTALHGDEQVLDLGTGSAIIAAALAAAGAQVTAADGSRRMLENAERRSAKAGLSIKFEMVDLIDESSLEDLTVRYPGKFDVVILSMTLKEMSAIGPLAKALPRLLSSRGRVVVVNLHPVFSKPSGHRAIEVLENDETGEQEFQRYIKVTRYLDIEPVKSEALRGQPFPLILFHRPFWSLLDPFFRNGLVMDAMREPAFSGALDSSQAQSYHNFQQFPMLLAFRLRKL